MQTKTLTLSQYEHQLLWVLGSTAVFLVVMYIYLVNSTVFNIMAVREGGEKMTMLSSKVAELETAYIAQANTVDMTLATSLGFKEISNTHTAYANRAGAGSLSLR